MFLVGDLGWHRYARKRLEEFDFYGNDMLNFVVSERIKQEKWGRGIGLYGGVGVGKTYLLVQLYKNRYWWAVQTKGKVGFPVWIDFWDLVYDVKKYGISILDDVLVGDIVFVDDFLVRVIDWETERMVASYIVYKAYDGGKVLCFTSNMSVDEWDVDLRVKDRVKEICEVYEVIGKSRRKEVSLGGL